MSCLMASPGIPGCPVLCPSIPLDCILMWTRPISTANYVYVLHTMNRRCMLIETFFMMSP